MAIETSSHELSPQESPQLQRILLLISYDGTDYSGFARQDGGIVTVAGTLEAAIRDIDPLASHITCSSRTDAGVHARGQPISFTTTRPLTSRGWVLALAQRVPASIGIMRASKVRINFDPRKDPQWKRYRYRVFPSQVEDPFLSRVTWRVGNNLNLSLMRAEAASLLGEHDFQAFRSIHCYRTETTRRIDKVEVMPSPFDDRAIDIVVQGNRFMYNMVRIIAGTLVDVARQRREPGACARAILSGNRGDLGMTAPPRGLTLEHVELRNWGNQPWPQPPPSPAESP